ncbi:condensation domain-containing protein, partial [Pandoraea sputorum]|uniref:condensation domain-containing protein n=2 Tax=Pseudomonadota TaxID=1224 RepID=UPI003558ED53
DNEQSIQIIHPAQPFTLDIEHLPAGQSVESWVEEQVRRPFDLEQGPLLRVTLLALADDEHVLVVTLHHIISDGWSMPIMINELIQLYEGFSQGQAVDLPALPI